MNYFIRHIDSQLQQEIKFNPLEAENIRKFKRDFLLIFIISFLWNEFEATNGAELYLEERQKIIESLRRINYGDQIKLIIKLDKNILKYESRDVKYRDKFLSIKDLADIRNNYEGHFHAFGDRIDEKNKFCDELCDLMIKYISEKISEEQDIIKILRIENGFFIGEHFIDTGKRDECKIPEEDFDYLQTGLLYFKYISKEGGTKYVKLTPFIHLDFKSNTIWAFNSLEEPKICKIKYSTYPNVSDPYRAWNDILNYEDRSKNKRWSLNKTCINLYKNNFEAYYDFGLKDSIKKYIIGEFSKSSVSFTLWGHGGVGKTAVTQSLCEDLFNSDVKIFDYIIFTSAKDRVYTKTGNIDIKIENKVSSLEDILTLIEQITCFNNTKSILDQFREYESGRILLVVDDFETFKRDEQIKINEFIKCLNSEHHKVIITTRNNPDSRSSSLSTSELTKEHTINLIRFLLEKTSIKLPIPKIIEEFDVLDEQELEKIFIITSGRPLFINRLIDIVLDSKSFKKGLKTNISKTKNAIDFLYGRFLDDIRVKDSLAEKIYLAIGSITDKETLTGTLESLKYVLQWELEEEIFNKSLKKLVELKIISLDNSQVYTVYASELLSLMDEQFKCFENNEFKREINIRKLHLAKDKKVIYSYLNSAQSAITSSIYNQDQVIELFSKVLDRDNYIDKLDLSSVLDLKSTALKSLVDYLYYRMGEKDESIKIYLKYLKQFENYKIYPIILFEYAKYVWNSSLKEYNQGLFYKIEEYFGTFKFHNQDESLSRINLFCFYLAIKCSSLISQSEEIKNRRLEIENYEYSSLKQELTHKMETLYKNVGTDLINVLQYPNNITLITTEDYDSSELIKNLNYALYSLLGIIKRLLNNQFEYRKIAINLCDLAVEILKEKGHRFIEQKDLIHAYTSNDLTNNFEEALKNSYFPNIKNSIDHVLLEKSIDDKLKLNLLFKFINYLKKFKKFSLLNDYASNYSNLVSTSTLNQNNIEKVVELYCLTNYKNLDSKIIANVVNFLEHYFVQSNYSQLSTQKDVKLYSLMIYLKIVPFIDKNLEYEDSIKDIINKEFRRLFVYLKNNDVNFFHINTKRSLAYSLNSVVKICQNNLNFNEYADIVMTLRDTILPDIRATV